MHAKSNIRTISTNRYVPRGSQVAQSYSGDKLVSGPDRIPTWQNGMPEPPFEEIARS
jgi:hypothetical protein